MSNNQKKIDFSVLEEQAGISFNNKELLQHALTHSSFAKRNREAKTQDNERLEFFGDAVLKLIVSDYLFHKYPHYNEGKLTKKRAQIVSDKMLSHIASGLDLGSFLKLSFGERRAGGAERTSILADAVEALLGAYYLDSGYEKVKEFFINQLKNTPEEAKLELQDNKTLLQEWLQKNNHDLPLYDVEKTEGPDHDKTFHIIATVKINNEVYTGEGYGRSKKDAEQKAAKKLVAALNIK